MENSTLNLQPSKFLYRLADLADWEQARQTGFFVSAVRKNWHLSSTYEPGKKAPVKVKPTNSPASAALPPVGAVVRVAGDSGQHRVTEHKWSGGEWRAVVEHVTGGWLSVVEGRKLRAG